MSTATDVARRLFEARVGTRAPSVDEFVSVLVEFSEVLFDVGSSSGDADGFLFQGNPATWTEEPSFVVGVTRQLELPGDDGQFMQVVMEYTLPLDPELARTQLGPRWWFREEGVPFATFTEDFFGDLLRRLLAGRVPTFTVYDGGGE